MDHRDCILEVYSINGNRSIGAFPIETHPTLYMGCPNCGSNEHAISELDSSICCSNCGTILENPGLVSHDVNAPYYNERSKEDVAGLRQTWFKKVAAFYGLGLDIQTVGLELFSKHRTELPSGALNEICVGIVCYIAKGTTSSWGYDDFIAAFPYPLYKPNVIKTFLIVGGKSKMWEETMDSQFTYTMDQIYEKIESRLFKKAVPDNFNLSTLEVYTRKLLDLGRRYDLNSGMKGRPLITAAACLCASYLSTQAPVKHVRRKPRVDALRKKYYYRWNFELFSGVIYSSHTYVKNLYNSYYNLIFQCVKKLNWVNCNSPRESIFHLDDVLMLFLPGESQKPKMTLDLSLTHPIAFLRSLEKSALMDEYVRDAKNHIIHGTIPEDPQALTTSIYSLLIAGYEEKDFLQWTPSCIRSVSNMLDFRSTYGSRKYEDRDMDYPILSAEDMSNEEINVYLKYLP